MSVFVFVHDDHADWELGYLLPELRSPAVSPQIEKQPRRVATFGIDGAPIVSMGGLRITPDLSLSAVVADEVEALVLPGGTFWRSFRDERLDALVLAARRRRALVAGICGATGYLARLGLLDSVAHTSN